jgi:hypothetical protein
MLLYIAKRPVQLYVFAVINKHQFYGKAGIGRYYVRWGKWYCYCYKTIRPFSNWPNS